MSDQPRYLDATTWGKIYAKAWVDPSFHEQLENDPTTAVKEFCKSHGINLDGVKIMRITARPGDLTDKQLTEVIAGGCSLHVLPDLSC